jgi:hypothetical protein
MPTKGEMIQIAITSAALYAAYKYGNAAVKMGAVSIAAVMIANRIPVVQDVVSP